MPGALMRRGATPDVPAQRKIVETFFLMADKRALRTHFYQDLFRDQGSCPECGDMAPASAQHGHGRPEIYHIRATQHAA
jgi:hypothetical protein